MAGTGVCSQEKEEARKRRRLERLKAAKPSSFEEWQKLQLAIAACS